MTPFVSNCTYPKTKSSEFGWFRVYLLFTLFVFFMNFSDFSDFVEHIIRFPSIFCLFYRFISDKLSAARIAISATFPSRIFLVTPDKTAYRARIN